MPIIQIAKTCPGCGAEFKVSPSRQVKTYCSPACRISHFKERQDARAKVCPVCGESFTPAKGREKKQTYCSRQCAGVEKRDRPRDASGWIDKNCLVCDEDFHVPQSRAEAKFCSPECSYEHMRGLPKNISDEGRSRLIGRPRTAEYKTRKCFICGSGFTIPDYENRIYCSRECYHESQRRPRPDLATGPVITCLNCGTQQRVSPSDGKTRKFCSKRCMYEHRSTEALSHLRDMTEAEVAWLAGLFDGEGSIIQAQRNRPNGGSLRISVANTVKPMLEKMCEITGVGSISCKKHDNPRWADCYTWSVSGAVALELLRRMRPWLFARAERADTVLAGKIFPRQARWDHRYGEDVNTG